MGYYESIHETLISDIFDTIKNGITKIDKKLSPKSSSIASANSLARATSALTMVFPVICTNALPIEVASMIAKAIERKNVAMLQMAFSAYTITNSADAIEYLSTFHTNLDANKITVDKFISIMDTLTESASVYIPANIIQEIADDCKRNTNYILEDSVSESSMLSFKEINKFDSSHVIKEADNDANNKPDYRKMMYDDNKAERELRKAELGQKEKERQDRLSRDTYDRQLKQQDYETRRKEDRDLRTSELNQRKAELDQRKEEMKKKEELDQQQRKEDREDRQKQNDIQNALNVAKNNLSKRSEDRQALQAMLLPSDVKKANEMQPSLMIVNFYVNDKDKALNVAQQFVAGVKSKLYSVDSSDIIDKIITKHADSDILLKLVQVSTREISFIKDFLLGIDDAKLDALNRSKKGSGSAIFNALEDRALNGKVRRALKNNNMYKAISTLVVSMEEVDQLKKYNNIDLTKVKITSKIMSKLNLLYFVIVDTTSEAVYMLTDGEASYETISFTNLERDNGDSVYKKVIGLMTKVSR